MRVSKFLLFAFILTSFFICSAFSRNQAFARPQNPRTSYARAESRYKRLLKDKKKRRFRTSWELCIARFDRVASSSRGTSARLASYSRAEAREGLYKVSRVQADLDAAAKAYSECIQNYPGTAVAAKASKRLKALGIPLSTQPAVKNNKAEKTAAPATVTVTVPATAPAVVTATVTTTAPAPAPPAEKGTKDAGFNSATEENVPDANVQKDAESSKGPVRINEIRHWSNTGYTRVVIDMNGTVQYSSSRLKNPDRLFFDLKNARLPKDCKGSDIDVNDGILRKIRASQFDANTVRVVLDLASIASSRTLMLEHPTRLIIDVTGQERKARAIQVSRYRRGKGGRVITLRPVNDLGTAAPLEERATGSAPEVPASTLSPSPRGTHSGGSAGPGNAGETSAPDESAPQPPAETGKTGAIDEEKVLDAAPYPNTPKLGFASTIVPVTRQVPAPAPRRCAIGTIVIDPGHGGKDTGAIGCNGLYEKDVVLDIGLKLRAIIKKNFACKVVMTRDKDVFIDLDARPGIAVQNDADLFISIHANASKSPSAHGIETYLLNLTKDRNIMEVADRENFAEAKHMGSLDVILKDLILDSKRDESLKLAHCVQTSLVTDLHKDGVFNKGVKQGPFLVLYGASMPSILTEVGFITNPEEEAHLADPEYREKIAQAIFDGIKEYIGSSRMAQYQAPK
jgi:N-acetylmuramoyl-L-alanine amidase